MPAYYNEIDPYAAQWLRNLIKEDLIADGEVDTRSIVDVRPGDLVAFEQCHFFGGIGGWSAALRLAGIADTEPLWTGSCPCQPFSSAGKRKGFADERHLWPVWRELIRERRPAKVFGEQVATARDWIDACHSDMEDLGYAFAAAILPACSVDAPHRRERLWFVAHADRERQPWRPESDLWQIKPEQQTPRRDHSLRCDFTMGHANSTPQDTRAAEGPSRRATGQSGWWETEPGVGRVADGVPARVGKLRALGNAIVPQVAAAFIEAAMSVERKPYSGADS